MRLLKEVRAVVLYRVIIGIFIFLGLYFTGQFIMNGREIKPNKWRNIPQTSVNARKELITGKKLSGFDKFKAEAEDALRLSNTKLTWEQFEGVLIVFTIIGVVIGIILHNILLCVVLGGIMTYVPVIIMKLKQYKYSMYINDQLQSAMNTVTTAYLKNDDINIAVKENLNRIDEPLNAIFREFVASNMFIDSDIVRNIRFMRSRVNNHFFHEWCDALILCQSDRNVKYMLPTIIEEMSDVKNIQEEANTVMMQIYKEFGLVAGMVIANIPFMKLLNSDWFTYLTQTFPGKFIVIITFIVIFISLIYVVKVNKPVSDL